MKSFAIAAALLCASVSSAVAAPADAGSDLEARWGKKSSHHKGKKSWHPKKHSKPWKKAQTITKVVIVYKPTTVIEHGKTKTKTVTSTCTQEQVTTVTDPGQTITGTVTATTTLSMGQNFTLTSVSTVTATPPSTNRIFTQNAQQINQGSPIANPTLYALNANGYYVVDKTATTATLFNSAGVDAFPGNATNFSPSGNLPRTPTGPCFWITDPAYASAGGQNGGNPTDQCVLGVSTTQVYTSYTNAQGSTYNYGPLVSACYTRGYGFTQNVQPLLFCNSQNTGTTKNTSPSAQNFVQAETTFNQLIDLFQPINGTGGIIVGYSTGAYGLGTNSYSYAELDANAPAGYILDMPSF